MKIPLNRQAKQPIYLQIRDRINHLIQTGHLAPNTQLPSIRTLAQTTQVNKLTVLEAYSRLEADGLVRVKQGAGFFYQCTPASGHGCPDGYVQSRSKSHPPNPRDQRLSRYLRRLASLPCPPRLYRLWLGLPHSPPA